MQLEIDSCAPSAEMLVGSSWLLFELANGSWPAMDACSLAPKQLTNGCLAGLGKCDPNEMIEELDAEAGRRLCAPCSAHDC